MRSSTLLSAFADIGLADRPAVGGKGASLGELERAGIAVPPGFVVRTEAFEALLRALERESPLAVTLVQGVSAGEKMDFTVQKATELGVAALQPLVCERSTGRIAGERAAQKRAHWQRVAIAACEQCGRNRVPEILAPLALEQYCRDAAPGNGLLLSPEAHVSLREAAAQLGKAVTLAAGPESGFTGRERTLLAQSGFVPVRLGPRVLRTETAALAALAALNALAGDF